MRKILIGVIFIIGTLAFAEDIKIGVITSQTGAMSILGQSTLNGIQMATDQINAKGGVNGRNIKLIVEDNKSNTIGSISSMQKLTYADKVDVVIGPILNMDCVEAAKIAQQTKTPMITPTGTDEKITEAGEYASTICFPDKFQGEVMADFAVEKLNAKKAVIMRAEGNFTQQQISDEFKKVFEKNGGKVVEEAVYSLNNIDYTKIMVEVKKKTPDVIFMPGDYMEAIAILKQAKEQQIQAVMLGGEGWNNKGLFDIAGKLAEGSYISTYFTPDGPDPMVQGFLKKYKEKFNIDANLLAVLGYDAAMLAVDAIGRAGVNADREKIKDAINTTQNFRGITGLITINEKRTAVKSTNVLTATGGKFVYNTNINPLSSGADKKNDKSKSNNNVIIIIGVLALVAVVGYGVYSGKKVKKD